MKTEFIVATKEFKDHLTSKRFLLIFTVLILMSIAAIITGVGYYHSQLANYNSVLMLASSGNNSDFMSPPPMPSMMLVFQSFSEIFATVGWLLPIAIGFDLISKEKETGSLKQLLARPLFRDSIINGKIIGSTALLIVALAATFLVMIALLLLQGIIPTGDDLINIVSFFPILVIFSLAFLAIALTASVLAKNSTMAMLMAIGFVVFCLLIPNFSSSVSSIILGPAPPATIPYTNSSNSGTSQTGAGGPGTRVANIVSSNGVRMEINPAYNAYEQNAEIITRLMDLISPTSDFTGISSAIVQPSTITIGENEKGGNVGIERHSASAAIPYIIALLVITIVGFAIAYARFMRMDVR